MGFRVSYTLNPKPLNPKPLNRLGLQSNGTCLAMPLRHRTLNPGTQLNSTSCTAGLCGTCRRIQKYDSCLRTSCEVLAFHLYTVHPHLLKLYKHQKTGKTRFHSCMSCPGKVLRAPARQLRCKLRTTFDLGTKAWSALAKGCGVRWSLREPDEQRKRELQPAPNPLEATRSVAVIYMSPEQRQSRSASTPESKRQGQAIKTAVPRRCT